MARFAAVVIHGVHHHILQRTRKTMMREVKIGEKQQEEFSTSLQIKYVFKQPIEFEYCPGCERKRK
jgi:hypothetical protein